MAEPLDPKKVVSIEKLTRLIKALEREEILKQGAQKIGAWLLEHPAVFITLLTGFLYIVVWSHYSVFYGKFGIAPNEVGINYGDIVRDALIVFLVGIFVFGALWLFIFISAWLILFVSLMLVALIHDILKPKDKKKWLFNRAEIKNMFKDFTNEFKPFAILIPIGTLIVGLAFFGRLYVYKKAYDVKQGKAVVTSDIFSCVKIRVEPVSVKMSHSLPGKSNLKEWKSMMLLGQAGGTTVLYDHERGETIRVPSSSLIIIRPQLKATEVK